MNLVRCTAIVAACMSAAPMASAFDWSPDTTRILGDPSFIPTAGQVSGSFGYTYSASLYDFRSSYGQYPISYDRSTNAFLPALQYGLLDDLTIFADLGFGNIRSRAISTYDRLVFTPIPPAPASASGFGVYNPGLTVPQPAFHYVPTRTETRYRAIGADNPTFGLDWRAIDQREAPVSVDLIGSYTPDIFQGRQSTVTQTGSFADGGQSGSAELAVSRETRFLTLRVFGTFSYEGRRNDISFGRGADIRSAPHPSYAVGLESQARLLPWLAINAGVTAQQAARYDRFVISPGETTPETIKPSGELSPYVGALVPLLDRHIVGELRYQHDFVNDETYDLPYGQEYRYYKQGGNAYTARVLFAFGGHALPTPAVAAPLPPTVLPGSPARTYLVFFDWDRADLTERARQIVAQAAEASAHATTRIEVNGYTDLSGTAAYNQRLSIRRAQSVQAELMHDGVAGNEIGIHGYGETNPLVPTAAGVREPQNRRVEILLR